ncbi:MAG: M20 family metallopeptidase [Planctomycetia bacterium]|nr:M20 family metallopeptidase [Planctomycetia bacterium]
MAHAVETTLLLKELVSRPSVNPMGRQLPAEITLEHRVTAYLEEFFLGLGVRWERQPVAPQRENIVAYFESPGARRTYVWEAHQDTVPIDHMTIEPFGAVIANGKLSGRGSCDIKGGMACMLGAFARLVREKPKEAANVIMACTVDEEFTFLGVQRLAKSLRADCAIVAEPTQLKIVQAHKGVARWYVQTGGRACHASSPQLGVNAIYRMGRVLTAIEQYAAELQRSRSDPLLGPPTLSVGIITGGTSANTVPDRCRIEVDRRLIPGEDMQAAPRQLEEFLRTRAGLDFPVEVTPPWLAAPALGPAGSEALIQQLGAAIAASRGSFEVTAVPYGTDASTIAEAGIPAVVFGPGDIAQAHTCDEWVDLGEVELASEILFRLAIAG